jgi:hypothetical protein
LQASVCMAKSESFEEFQIKEYGRTAQDERSYLKELLFAVIVLGAGMTFVGLKYERLFFFTFFGIPISVLSVAALVAMHYQGSGKKS